MTDYVTVDDTETVLRDGTIKLHGPAGFEGMRKAGRLAAEISMPSRHWCSPA
jgi:methionyl aminopeptidase